MSVASIPSLTSTRLLSSTHISATTPISTGAYKPVSTVSMKVVEKYTLVSGSILCQAVEETGDKKYDYSRTLYHYACLVLKFTDA